MLRSLALSRVLLAAIIIVAVFAFLRFIFSPSDLIILLNGLFAGAIVAVCIAYSKLVWYAALGVGKYDRVRQMTLGFALCWAAISISAITSIWMRIIDLTPVAFTSVAFARYIAIIAAVMQVTAPDFGLGLFHGRDRKVLYSATVIGLIVAVAVMVLQGA